MAQAELDLIINVKGEENLAKVRKTLDYTQKEARELGGSIDKAFDGSGASQLDNDLKKATGAIKTQTSELDKLNKRTKELRNARNNAAKSFDIKGVRAYNAEIKKSKNEIRALSSETKKGGRAIGDFASNFGGAIGASFSRFFQGASAGLKVVISGFKSLRLAIASTGIGLLVIALGSVVAFFTKTQRGADLLSQALSGVRAAISVLIDRLSLFGEAIVEAFSNPQRAIVDTGNAIRDNIQRRFEGLVDLFRSGSSIISNVFLLLANRIKISLADVPIIGKAIDVKETEDRIKELSGNISKEFGEFGESAIQTVTGVDDAVNKLTNSFSALGEEISEETAAAIALEKRNQVLLDQEIDFIKTKAALRAEIEKNRLAAEDETLSYQERVQALKDAEATQDRITQREIQFQSERARIIKEQVALGESTRDELRGAAEAEARVIELTGERDRAVKRLTTRLNALTKEQEASERAATKQVEEITKAYNDIAKDLSLDVDVNFNVPDEFVVPLRVAESTNIDKLESSISQLNEGFSKLGDGSGEAISLIDDSLKKLSENPIFKEASLVGANFLDSYSIGLDNAISKNEEFLSSLETTIQGLQDEVDKEKSLAEQGFANDQAVAEKRLAAAQEQQRKAQQQQEEAVRKQQILDNIAAKGNLAIAISGALRSAFTGPNAAVGALIAGASIAAILALFEKSVASANTISFYDGTENTGNGGKVDSKGGFNAILHPNERVVPAKDNKYLSGIKNSELPAMAAMYKQSKIKPNYDYMDGLKVSNNEITNLIALGKMESLMRNNTNELRNVNRSISGSKTLSIKGSKTITTKGNRTVING